jgi:hypothetical protein
MMKSLKLCVLLLVICCACEAQYKELDVYYPENSLYKKLHVAKVVDVTSTPHMVNEYDQKGREIAWYYVDDTSRTRYSYTYSGDTLVKAHQSEVNGILETTLNELYLYDKKGKIIYYAYVNLSDEDSTNENYFDIISYGKNSFTRVRKFTGSVSDNEKKTYLYEKTKDGKIDLKKSFNHDGKLLTIDSIFYDANKRKMREVTFTKEGYAGEFKISNLLWVNKYVYKKGKVVIMTFKGTKKEVTQSKNASVTEMVYLDNGLLSEIYLGDTSSTTLSSKYEYSFW